MPSSLESLQADFSAALTGAAVPAHLAQALIGSEAHLAARLALYRRDVSSGWRNALALAFPVVLALVGADCFDGLAERYGRAHPSTDGDLHRFGAHFPAFVAVDAAVSGLPYLHDVAALEWAVHGAQRAADVAPLPRERLVALSPAGLLAARFAVHPACTWLASPHPIVGIWSAHQADATTGLDSIGAGPEYALVSRRRWRVTVTPITRGDVLALDALRAGADMDRTISAALLGDASFEFAKAFLRWLDCHVFTGFDAPPAP